MSKKNAVQKVEVAAGATQLASGTVTDRQESTRIIGALNDRGIDAPNNPHPGSNLPASGTAVDEQTAMKVAKKQGTVKKTAKLLPAAAPNNVLVSANAIDAVTAPPTVVAEQVTRVADESAPEAAGIPGTRANQLATGTVVDSKSRTPRHGHHKPPTKKSLMAAKKSAAKK